MEIKPDYYDAFRCIANECKHNCCIGWEIDIDSETLEKYSSETGALKKKLQKSIDLEPCAHFVLDGERCPFLNRHNLCELILHGGEDMLCQICKDHPRFYNNVYGVCEKGIGLCCEEAARIILTSTAPFKLISAGGDIPQNDFYLERNRIFNILQDREKPLGNRITAVLNLLNVSSPINKRDWIDVYKGLERLDGEWDKHLSSIDRISDDIPQNLEVPLEQLLCYFIYRHLSGALQDFLFGERIQLAVLSCYIIANICKSKTVEEMIEVARMYSSEIEYSDENIEILLQELQEFNEL